MVGDRSALRTARLLVLVLLGEPQPADDGAGRHLARLERQLELVGALARGAEPVCPVARELMAQLLDQQRLGLHLGDQEPCEGLQIARVLGQRHGLVEHGR